MLVCVEKAYWPYVLHRFFVGPEIRKKFLSYKFRKTHLPGGGLGLRSGVLGFVVHVKDGATQLLICEKLSLATV